VCGEKKKKRATFLCLCFGGKLNLGKDPAAESMGSKFAFLNNYRIVDIEAMEMDICVWVLFYCIDLYEEFCTSTDFYYSI
jgi:hypothetical protein